MSVEKMRERCEKADVNDAGGGRALRAEEGMSGCPVALLGVLSCVPCGWVGVSMSLGGAGGSDSVRHAGHAGHAAPEPDKQRHFSIARA